MTMVVGSHRRDVVRCLGPLGLMPAAAFAVHQLRYWLAFGSRAGTELQSQGHSYLHSWVPWIMLLVAMSIGVFLRALGRALGGGCSVPRSTISFVGLWLVCAAGLVVIYALQESLEGLFATGHPGGLIGIFGYGGWWSIPVALAVGLVLAAVFHGAAWVLNEVAQRQRRGVWPTALRPAAARVPRAALPPRSAPLAYGWSGRGPPR